MRLRSVLRPILLEPCMKTALDSCPKLAENLSKPPESFVPNDHLDTWLDDSASYTSSLLNLLIFLSCFDFVDTVHWAWYHFGARFLFNYPHKIAQAQ
jgi:hypothetical protein